MGTLVVRLADGQYVKWSNTTDSPVTYVMNRDELIEHLLATEQLTFSEAAHLLDEADENGTSDPTTTLEELVDTNAAGDDESTLSLAEIITQYQRDA